MLFFVQTTQDLLTQPRNFFAQTGVNFSSCVGKMGKRSLGELLKLLVGRLERRVREIGQHDQDIAQFSATHSAAAIANRAVLDAYRWCQSRYRRALDLDGE